MASRLLSSLNVYEAVLPEFVFTEESGIFLISQGPIGLYRLHTERTLNVGN